MSADIADNGIRKILNQVDEADLKQLALTTTQNSLKPELINTKKDTIEVIIQYSSDFSTILNRKCVKKDILFQYLHDNKIYVKPPITKLLLIQKILDFWTHYSNNQQISKNSNKIEQQNESSSNEEINIMANQFTEWFYNILNKDEKISEEHFWQECSLQINLTSPASHYENSAENNRSEVVNMLYKTKCDHGLFFNPNLTSDGVYGKMDAHGLVIIFACGTLHTKENCVGVFEQIFSLARDPFCENNWKIKNTRLNLRSKEVTETPRLCDSGINDDLLLYITNS